MSKHFSVSTGKVPPQVLRAHLVMGALQLVSGSLVLALNVALAAAGGQALIGSGFWAGGFFLAAGAAGVFVGRGGACGSRSCAAACLALSVLASGLALGAIIGEGVVISANSENHRLKKKCRPNQDLSTYLGLSITCLIIFLFEFVLATVHAAYAYRVCWCISQPPQPQQPPQQTEDQLPAVENFLIIETDNGQRILVPAAAVASAAEGAVVLPLEQTGGSALSNDLLPAAEPQPPYNPHFMDAQPPPYKEAENRFYSAGAAVEKTSGPPH